MLRKTNSRSGFTLVEIMIVVAIIALLASIAIPNFLRARKRAQATQILEDLRILDAAKDQYAIENNKKGAVAPAWLDLKTYVKATTKLYVRAGFDPFGASYIIGSVDGPTKANADVYTEFSNVVDSSFWDGYR